MERRFFEHLYNEICVAVGRRISRYDLWLLVWDGGGDPNDLTHPRARNFIENDLSVLLREEGIHLSDRSRHRLSKRILRFDARHPTPEEWFSSLFSPTQKAA